MTNTKRIELLADTLAPFVIRGIVSPMAAVQIIDAIIKAIWGKK